MGNFIFYAVRSVYSIKWNPLDGQVDDARSKKNVFKDKKKKKHVAFSSHIPYATFAFFCCMILVVAAIMEH